MCAPENGKFRIVYMPSYQNEFLVNILASPFMTAKKEAEKEFLKLLDISEKDACWLYIVITTDTYANPDYADKNYRLSFCADSNNADINKDKAVNTIDYALVVKKYGRLGKNIKEDINGDEAVNALDLSLVLAKLGEKVTP